MRELEHLIDNPPIRPDFTQIVALNVDSDLDLVNKPLLPNPFPSDLVEKIFTQSRFFFSQGIKFQNHGDYTWTLTWNQQTHKITFYPDIYEEFPSLKFMSFGEPLFERLLSLVYPWTSPLGKLDLLD